MAREIEIVYSTVGTADVTLTSDLPSGTLTTVATTTLAATSGEKTRKWRLTGLIRGRLFQLRIEPTTDFRLEGLKMRVKMIGEPHATAWGWIDFPLTPTSDGIWVPLSFGQDQIA